MSIFMKLHFDINTLLKLKINKDEAIFSAVKTL